MTRNNECQEQIQVSLVPTVVRPIYPAMNIIESSSPLRWMFRIFGIAYITIPAGIGHLVADALICTANNAANVWIFFNSRYELCWEKEYTVLSFGALWLFLYGFAALFVIYTP